MERNDNYAKSLKNWVVIISSVTFLVNLFCLKNGNKEWFSLWLVSFTFLASTGLTFYGLVPQSSKTITRRHYIINSSMGCIASVVIGGVISSQSPAIVGVILFWIIKILFLIFCCSSYVFTFLDDSDSRTDREKKAGLETRKNLQEDEKKKPYADRDRNIKENRKTKAFLIKKRGNKEENEK